MKAPLKPSALILAGPTATGKTELAHQLARRRCTWILSADSMLIYQGMDIGTAKPTPEQMAECVYRGVNLASPDARFSVHDYLAVVRAIPTEAWETPPIVVGGTGLYLNALLYGLDDEGAPESDVRAELEALLESGGIEALQARARDTFPGLLDQLPDPRNPRRVIRAIERAIGGSPRHSGAWQARRAAAHCLQVPVLDCAPGVLSERIQHRVARMYAAGLLDEVRALRAAFPVWSKTAGQAIGYAEAAAVLAGTLGLDEAMAHTCARTRRLAKRQRTWFRHQLPARWIDTGDRSLDDVAMDIETIWKEPNGCIDLNFNS